LLVSRSAAPSLFGPSDRALGSYVQRTVRAYSAYYRQALDAAGISRVKGRGDLARLPPTDLAEIPDPAALVLRVDLGAIVGHGHPVLAARTAVAKASGGLHGFNDRVIERRFRPVHWFLAAGVPIGYSATDLQRLAARGASWLELAGVRHSDVLVSMLPSEEIAQQQLVLGCRRLRVSAIHLDAGAEPTLVDRLGPSVLVGSAAGVGSLLERARDAGHGLANVRTILVVGDPLASDTRRRLAELGGAAAVVGAWAPPGVRAIWTECRPGAEGTPAGYHAWPDDVLELTPAGELLWTGVGWSGTALLRLRTRAVVALAGAACPACGQPGARVTPVAPVPAVLPAVPVAIPAPPVVTTTIEAVVTLAPAVGAAVVPLLRRLDRHIGATQFIVVGDSDGVGT
jgi:hypothetical protein